MTIAAPLGGTSAEAREIAESINDGGLLFFRSCGRPTEHGRFVIGLATMPANCLRGKIVGVDSEARTYSVRGAVRYGRREHEWYAEGEVIVVDRRSLPTGLMSKLNQRKTLGLPSPSLFGDPVWDGARIATPADADDYNRPIRDRVNSLQAPSGPPDELPIELVFIGGGAFAVVFGLVLISSEGADAAAVGAGLVFAVGGLVAALPCIAAVLHTRRQKKALSEATLTDDDFTQIRSARRSLAVSRTASIEMLRARRASLPVADAIVIADNCRTRILSCQAWTSTYLDTHRVQFSPEGEVAQIVEHAMAIDSAAKRLGAEPRGDTPGARASRNAYDSARARLLLAFDSLLERVSVLADYTDHVEDLDVELKHLSRAEMTLRLDDDIALLINTGRDQLAADHMRHLDDDARAILAAIRDLLATLNGDLNTLRALAPVPRQ